MKLGNSIYKNIFSTISSNKNNLNPINLFASIYENALFNQICLEIETKIQILLDSENKR